MTGGIWSVFRNAVRDSLGKPTKRRRRDARANYLRYEALEPRQLLSVNTISFDAAASQVVIRGTADSDQVLITTEGSDSIRVRAESPGGVVEATLLTADVSSIRFSGYAGNDRFENRTGIRSEAFGGSGDDVLIGGGGNDRLLGEDGNDYIEGRAGNDELLGGEGSDTLIGGDGDDFLAGQGGDDTLYGNAGNDKLDGGTGNDKLLGGDGDDLLIGGDGNDMLSGQFGNDRLLGQQGDDYLSGGAGDDVLYGGLGDDRLFGGDGVDELYGQEGNDHLDGGAGDDRLDGGSGHDKLLGGDGNDRLVGGDGNDMLIGQGGNDRLLGQAGNDYLDGGSGDDLLYGGLGDDRLFGSDGQDQLNGQEGNDHLDGGAGDDLLDGGSGHDKLLGGDGNDQLVGGDGHDILYGGADNDRLLGQSGNDFLVGGTGDDVLLGGLGDDKLYGNEGNDDLSGNEGNDMLDGGDGNDKLTGNAGHDRLYGGAGDDVLVGNDGDDELWGGDGNDQLLGLDGNDLLFGGAGSDQLNGGAGNNVLVGGADDDSLYGGNAYDVLIGGTGKDVLEGAWGDDLLVGGTTIYDENPNQLRRLLAVWSSAAPYASRIASIESGFFAARLKLEETVFDDGVADAIYGGEGQDWFLLTGFMGVYNPNAEDHHHGDHNHDDESDHQHNTIIVDEIPALEGFALIDSLDRLNDRNSTETLRTLIPHADDPVLQREHLSLSQLVRYDQVTHFAANSGAWSNPATWHGGVAPTAGASVLIPIGVHVEVDGMIAARIGTIRVDGTLSFATSVNTELRVDTIVVTPTGAFEMGTELQPVAAGVKARLLITDNGPIDRMLDPFGIGRGLISHGRVTMHGAEVTSSAAIRVPPAAGAVQLRLYTAPVGWRVGDTIVIAATNAGAQQNEIVKIRGISGSLVLLDRPLAFDHIPVDENFRVHVINTTRNAVIESESTATDRRGHVMFMHNRDVHIANAGFYTLGRTDKLLPINDSVVDENWKLKEGTGTNGRARYSVHFHRTGFVNDGNPSTIRGSAVVDSPGWGFVNHSSYVDMVDNVAYGVRGAAFATEVGDEIGSFVRNVAIGTTGSGELLEARKQLQDFGHQGDGFWFQGPGVTVTNNIAAGNQGSAFAYFARGLIEGGERQSFLSANLVHSDIANGAEEVSVGAVPVLKFEGNVGYASRIGLSAWYLMEHATHSHQSVISNSLFWNNTFGVDLPYTRKTTLENIQIVHGSSTSSGDGVGMNLVTQDIVYRNLTVSGYTRGIVLPRRGYAIVEGGLISSNSQDIFVLPGLSQNRTVLITGQSIAPRIYMSGNYRSIDGHINQYFTADYVVLNFGPFSNQRAYYNTQLPHVVPFTSPIDGVPEQYIGLTAQELWDQYGVVAGGTLAPGDTFASPLVSGGVVGPAI